MRKYSFGIYLLMFLVIELCSVAGTSHALTAIELSELEKNTFASGPSSGQIKYKKDVSKVLVDKQWVMGISALIKTKVSYIYLGLTDNGFSEKNASSDFIPRLYEINIAPNNNALHQEALYTGKYLEFTDKFKKLSFKIQADYEHYNNLLSNPLVDERIKSSRILTGGDFDPESIQVGADGHIWIGEEFGPFLLEADSSGNILHQEFSIPGINSKNHPHRQLPVNANSGFEGMAISNDKSKLYLMIEEPLTGDDQQLRMYKFDIGSKLFNTNYQKYMLDQDCHAVSDMVMVNSHELLVLEVNSKTKKNQTLCKKIYLIDLNLTTEDGVLSKSIIADLTGIKDSKIKARFGKLANVLPDKDIFEGLDIVDSQHLIISNDSDGKTQTRFFTLQIDALHYIPPSLASDKLELKIDKITPKKMASVYQSVNGVIFKDNNFIGWLTTILYFTLSIRLIVVTRMAKQYNIDFKFWLLVTITVCFFAFNKQLDLQTDITHYFRILARQGGWYEMRQILQMSFVAFYGLLTLLILILVRSFFGHLWVKYRPVIFGLCILSLFVLTRLISLHHIDQIYKQKFFIAKGYQLVELFAIFILMYASFYYRNAYFTSAEFVRKKLINNCLIIEGNDIPIQCPRCFQPMRSLAEHGKAFKCKACKYKFTTVL